MGSDLDEMTARMRKLAGKGPSRAKALREPHTSIAKVMQDRGRKNSRTKGNSYELRIAKAFAQWSGEHIRRTPQSGGWSNAKFGVSADLVCDNPKWPFHIECKKREGWHLDDLITGIRPDDTRSIEAWWKQTVDSCPKKGYTKKGYTTTPMLVFARNRGPSLVMMRAWDLHNLDLDPTELPLFTVQSSAKLGDSTYDDRVVLTLDTFFANVRPPKHTKNHKKWSPT